MNIISPKIATLGAALFASALMVATANASTTHQELVELSGGAPAVTLPDVTVGPATPSGASVYDTGHGVKTSSEHFIAPSHYQVPPGYDRMVAMHPYTSGVAVCTEGAAPAQGCHHDTGHPIPPSRYERMPFMQ
jgi:hypothetical protein